MLFLSAGMIIGGFVIGFIKGWLFSICILALAPLGFLGIFMMVKNQMKGIQIQNACYSKAGSISDQAFS